MAHFAAANHTSLLLASPHVFREGREQLWSYISCSQVLLALEMGEISVQSPLPARGGQSGTPERHGEQNLLAEQLWSGMHAGLFGAKSCPQKVCPGVPNQLTQLAEEVALQFHNPLSAEVSLSKKIQQQHEFKCALPEASLKTDEGTEEPHGRLTLPCFKAHVTVPSNGPEQSDTRLQEDLHMGSPVTAGEAEERTPQKCDVLEEVSGQSGK